MTAATREARKALAGLAAGRIEALELGKDLIEENALSSHTLVLVRISALIAMDAPPASYAWQISEAVSAEVTAEELLGVLWTLAPLVGELRIVAAAPEIMLALGLSLPGEAE